MPPRRKGKEVDRKPAATRKPTKTTTGRVGIRSGLRPRPPIKNARIREGNSEPIRRKPISRKVKKSARSPGTPATGAAPLERVLESIETPLPETCRHIRGKLTGEGTSPDPQDTDPQ